MRTFLLAFLLTSVAGPTLAQPSAESTLADSTLAKAYRIFRPDGERARLDETSRGGGGFGHTGVSAGGDETGGAQS